VLEVSRTLYQVLRETAARYGDAPALRQPKPGQNSYATCSWNEYLRAAEEIAAGLRRLGLVKGDTVALNTEIGEIKLQARFGVQGYHVAFSDAQTAEAGGDFFRGAQVFVPGAGKRPGRATRLPQRDRIAVTVRRFREDLADSSESHI
jgi:hypothetical protein